jgi:DNA excision repair protein ERCC-2
MEAIVQVSGMDDRFLQGKYRRMLPLEWNDFHLLKNM